MTPERFQEHWRTRHAELIVRLPGIRRYVQNFPLEADSAWDGIAESSFDDTAAMKSLARSPEYAAVLADEPNFLEREAMVSVITEERVVKDGPAGGAKAIAWTRRGADVPLDKFFEEWIEQGRRTASGPAVLRYVQCQPRRAAYDSGRTPAYDGVEMMWLRSAAERPSGWALMGERVQRA
jgi:uncharacterized protein (TIGR02118 family)